jgi:RecA/RadA recombinase/intein/homing endonuclease
MVERYCASSAPSGPGTFLDRKEITYLNTGCTLLNCIIGGQRGGWPFGRIVNIVGDKSTGKCALDYFLLTSEGIKYSEDFIDSKPFGASKLGWTLALDRESNVKATQFWKEQVNLTYKVMTAHGFELTGTSDHKLQVLRSDGTLQMVRLKSLQPGDFLVVAPGTELFPERLVSLLDFRPRTSARSFAPISPRPQLNSMLAAWLGALIADGTTSSGPLVITAHKAWKRELLDEWSTQLFEGSFRRNATTYAYSSQVKELAVHCYGRPLKGTTARYKRVPALIAASSREVQAAFLRSLMAFDGEQPAKGGIVWSTASRLLAREVQMMLLNFGVHSTLGERYRAEQSWSYYTLGIYGERFDKFREVIGLLRPCSKRSTQKTTSDLLSIPFGGDMLREELQSLRKRLGWSRNGRLRDGRRLPSTGLLCRKALSSTSYKYFGGTLDKLQGLVSPEFQKKAELLLQKQFVFDKVVSKTTIRRRQIVSDVHVPQGHLFWASGFINHNTLLAEEAIANLQLSYPEAKAYYREAEAAFDASYATSLGVDVDKITFGPKGPAKLEDIKDYHWQTIEAVIDDLRRVLDAFDFEVERRVKVATELQVNKKRLAKKGTDKKKILRELEVEVLASMPPCVYVVDSLDALSSETELKRDIHEGSYNLTKQKLLGELFRTEVGRIKRAKMLMIIISQIRDRIGAMIRGAKYTRAGGRALDFYASVVIFLADLGKVYETNKGIKRPVAIKVKAKANKNKITQPFRECVFELRFGYGIDDEYACLDYLKEVGRLGDMGLEKVPDNLKKIDVPRLKMTTVKVFGEIEGMFLPPKGKYAA